MKVVSLKYYAFSTGRSSSTLSKAERSYRKILLNAENLYGKMSGEVGLVLLSLMNFYQQHNDFEMTSGIESRIDAIVDSYCLD